MTFTKNLSDKYGKKLLDIATKTRLVVAAKTASKKVVHKTAEATGELIGKTMPKRSVKPTPANDENSKTVEKIATPPDKRQEILNELRQVL